MSAALWRQVRDDFRASWRDLLLYYLLFSILAVLLLSPFVAWLFSRLVASSGQTAIGNFDIAVFLLKPKRLLIALGVASLFAAVSFLRISGQLLIGYGATDQVRVRYDQALLFVLRRARDVIILSLVILAMGAAILLPFLGLVWFLVSRLLGAHDINHYLEARPPEFWWAVGGGGILGLVVTVVLAYLMLRLVFSLPNVILERLRARVALRRSWLQTRGRWHQVAAVLLTWVIIWFLFATVVNWLMHSAGEILVTSVASRVNLLVLALGVLTSIGLTINFLLSFLGESVACLFAVRLLRSYDSREIKFHAFAEAIASVRDRSAWLTGRRTILPIGVVLLILTAFVVHGLLSRVRWEDQVDISAHRGSSAVAPENTLAAVERAIDDGADFVEIDVQRTADGAIVVAHDADLMRVAGNPIVISQARLADLMDVDIGSWFDPQFAQERPATLEQAIDVAEGRIKLIVELKSYKADARQLVLEVVSILRKRQMIDDAVIMSLKYDELMEVTRLAPEITVGFVASASLGDLTSLDVDFLAVSQSQATDLLIAAAHNRGKDVFVWTVDDPQTASLMIDRGVDNLITNDPATIVRVLQDRQDLTTAERILLRFRSLYLD